MNYMVDLSRHEGADTITLTPADTATDTLEWPNVYRVFTPNGFGIKTYKEGKMYGWSEAHNDQTLKRIAEMEAELRLHLQ